MKTIVIMAAGLGTRFSNNNKENCGGEKQTSYIDENNNCLFHLGIEDAIEAGFEKVVLIIRRNDQELFNNLIKDKFKDRIKIVFAYQEMDKYKLQNIIPQERTKPLGTVQAILSAKEDIEGNCFSVINADDYYGLETFKIASKLMDEESNDIRMVTFLAKNTLSNKGEVKRGVCILNKSNEIEEIKECKIKRDENGQIIARPIFGNLEPFEIPDETEISMQFFIFPTIILDYFEEHLNQKINSKDFDKMTGELILVETISYIQSKTNIKLLSTKSSSEWMGLTYKEDLDDVKTKIKQLYKKGYYKELLK